MFNNRIPVWLHTLKAYERHISAAAMIGGFAFDNLTYGRVDHPVTQTLLIVYIGVAAASILLLHWLEAHQAWQSGFVVKLRGYLPALTQFVLGSLWSAFLVFYARSGTVAASWPFLVILAAIFIGNEVFKKYYARLIFTTTLLCFALISYAAFMVPVFTHTIGQPTFLMSGIAAIMVFAGFVALLNLISMERLGQVKWKIAFGGIAVYALINALYFMNVLPPLPLAMQSSGVYNALCRVPAKRAAAIKCVGKPVPQNLTRSGRLYFAAMEEPGSWMSWFGVPRVVHIEKGDQVVVFGAIFSPTNLNTTTYYVWQHYDTTRGQWLTVQQFENSLRGGRDKGYRGYTYKTDPESGRWRVDFRTVDGRLIGRTSFTVESGAPPQPAKLVIL